MTNLNILKPLLALMMMAAAVEGGETAAAPGTDGPAAQAPVAEAPEPAPGPETKVTGAEAAEPERLTLRLRALFAEQRRVSAEIRAKETSLRKDNAEVREKLDAIDAEVRELEDRIRELKAGRVDVYRAAAPELTKLYERRDRIAAELMELRKAVRTPRLRKRARPTSVSPGSGRPQTGALPAGKPGQPTPGNTPPAAAE